MSVYNPPSKKTSSFNSADFSTSNTVANTTNDNRYLRLSTGGTVGGAVSVLGNLSSTGIVSTSNTTASTSSTTGAVVVSGGAGIGGDLTIGGQCVTQKLSDIINVISDASTLSINYNNGQVYYIASSASAKTTVAFTNMPTIQNRSYVFTFIFTTTNNVNIIGSGATISVNGSNLSTFAITPNTATSTVYFVENLILLNIGGTWTAMASYNGF